jgi:hypothetical protein
LEDEVSSHLMYFFYHIANAKIGKRVIKPRYHNQLRL